MDFTFTEEQETIAKVARQLFEHRVTPEHLTELEAGDVRYDAALWRELATADLLGIALPENVGGSGHGFVELALLLAEVGWSVAPVPVYATLLLGADTIARYGDDGQRAAVPSRCRQRLPPAHRGVGRAWALRPDRTRDHRASRRRPAGASTARKELVPAAQIAHTMLVPADARRRRRRRLPARRERRRCRDSTRGDDQWRAACRRNPRRCSRFRRGPACRRWRRDDRIAACPRACRAVRDPTRRDGACAAHRRVLHDRTRAVRQADRQLPGRAAADGRRVHRRRGDPVDHVAGRLASRPGRGRPAARPASRSSGRPRQARASRRPPSRCTAASASTSPIPCSVTSCGPSTTS